MIYRDKQTYKIHQIIEILPLNFSLKSLLVAENILGSNKLPRKKLSDVMKL